MYSSIANSWKLKLYFTRRNMWVKKKPRIVQRQDLPVDDTLMGASCKTTTRVVICPACEIVAPLIEIFKIIFYCLTC